MTLILIRHGNASVGIDSLDPPLDELGRAQALATAQALQGSNARRLVVSPLRRTLETAEPIAAELGITPQICNEVAEVFDPTWDVAVRREMIGPLLAGRWGDQNAELRRWRDRVIARLVELAAEETIVVSHFVAINAALGEALGEDRVTAMPLPNTAIARLALRGGRLTVIAPPSVEHLPSDLVSGAKNALIGRP
jgi:probable phosphoglycerate mutase